MLERSYGRIEFLCDGNHCNEFLETETRDFSEAKKTLNDAGWQTRKIGNEWLHICPLCVEAETPRIR